MGKFGDWMDKHSGKVVSVLVILIIISCIIPIVSGDVSSKLNESITTMTKGEFFCSIALIGLLTRSR
jgi:spore maturation protein SpmA